jgi:hypothetical protein
LHLVFDSKPLIVTGPSLYVASTPANHRGVFMRNAKRSISIGAVGAVAALSFAGLLYFAVSCGGAPKLDSGVAKAAESPDASPTGRSDRRPIFGVDRSSSPASSRSDPVMANVP